MTYFLYWLTNDLALRERCSTSSAQASMNTLRLLLESEYRKKWYCNTFFGIWRNIKESDKTYWNDEKKNMHSSRKVDFCCAILIFFFIQMVEKRKLHEHFFEILTRKFDLGYHLVFFGQIFFFQHQIYIPTYLFVCE